MSTTTFPFNDLPIELQREIFVLAATTDYRNARRLVWVARRAYAWIQPYIYEVVSLGNDDTNLFLRTMDFMAPRFFATYVRKMCLSVSVTPEDAERILRVCTGVVDLAFWVDHLGTYPDTSIAPFISGLPLQRLSIELSHFLSLFPSPKSRHAWCDTLTHLDIIFWTSEMSPTTSQLRKLSSLTHLALKFLDAQAHEDYIFHILSACEKLKVLIVFESESDASEDMMWCEDPRVVYMAPPPQAILDWELQAREDSTCNWSRAEELVKQHTAKQQQNLPPPINRELEE